jgi:hypothetical protein
MTPLDKTLKRSLTIKAVEYVVTLTPDALKLTRKGKRLGLELKWADITSGESALAVALHASIGRFDAEDSERIKSVSNSAAIKRKRTPVRAHPKTRTSKP